MSRFGIVDEFIDIEIEDELTKAVFGSLQLLGSEQLNTIFAAITADENFDISFTPSPKFIFHEQVERRIPDVIITDDQRSTIIVEAKLGAGTNPEQLADQYADLRENWETETKKLIHITQNRTRPSELDAIEEIPDTDLLWMTWRDLATILLELELDSMSSTDQQVIEMLIDILDMEGFAPFGGFTVMTDMDDSFTNQLNRAYEIREQYQRQANSFRKDVESRLDEEIEFWKFFRSGATGQHWAGIKQFPSDGWALITRHLWFVYRPVDYDARPAKDPIRENYLFIDFDTVSGSIRAGYTMTIEPGKVDDDLYREFLHQNQRNVLSILEDNNLRAFTTTNHFRPKLELESRDEIEDFLDVIGDSTYDADSYGKRFLIGREWLADELPLRAEEEERVDATETVTEVAHCLNKVHQLTYHQYVDTFYPVL